MLSTDFLTKKVLIFCKKKKKKKEMVQKALILVSVCFPLLTNQRICESFKIISKYFVDDNILTCGKQFEGLKSKMIYEIFSLIDC